MRGPDFEIPPLDPLPAPEDPPEPDGPLRVRPRTRAAAVVAVLAMLGSAAFAWYSAVVGTLSQPAAVVSPPPSTRALPSPSATSRVTPTSPARTAGRTCLDSQENPAAAREPPPSTPSWVTFHFAPRVATEALVRIAGVAADAREALGEAGALGIHVQCDIDEFAAATRTPPEELRRRVDEGLVAYILRSEIWIYGPSYDKRSAAERRQVIYHEYFHAVQQHLSRSRSARSDVAAPVWLIEGSAEYFEHAATQTSMETFRRRQLRRWDNLPPLQALEDSGGAQVIGGSGAAYAVGSVASDYLVTRYGRDLLQSEFWVAFAQTDWRSAFLQVFGVTVDAFYADFETYRGTLPP